MVAEIYPFYFCVGPSSICVHLHFMEISFLFWLEKDFGRKKIKVGKNFGSEKFWSEKHLGQKIFGLKKCCSEKKFGQKSFGLKKVLVRKKKFWKKMLVGKNL